MNPADPPSREPPVIEMRRAPWWAGGRWRAVRRRFPRYYDDLPLWARFGFMTPLPPTTLLLGAAVGCAAAGAVAIIIVLALRGWMV